LMNFDLFLALIRCVFLQIGSRSHGARHEMAQEGAHRRQEGRG
jgi:hypothetical protein